MFGVGERLITSKQDPVFGGVYKELPLFVQEAMKKAMMKQNSYIGKLSRYVDEDTTAFDGVMKAFKMPKNQEAFTKNC